jgi:hypothetical protein
MSQARNLPQKPIKSLRIFPLLTILTEVFKILQSLNQELAQIGYQGKFTIDFPKFRNKKPLVESPFFTISKSSNIVQLNTLEIPEKAKSLT